MFTGIIREIGIVAKYKRTDTGASLGIKSKEVLQDVEIGDSVAVNGVCLSVAEKKGDILSFDVIYETLSRTNIGLVKIDDFVNLEPSLKAGSKIGGHFVTGHIDYAGRIIEIIQGQKGYGIKVSLPEEFSKFVSEKGSIAIDGVSLTVAEVMKDSFTVYLIPLTLQNTTLGKVKRGSIVNIEVDILARYLLKQPHLPTLEEILKKYDYIK